MYQEDRVPIDSETRMVIAESKEQGGGRRRKLESIVISLHLVVA